MINKIIDRALEMNYEISVFDGMEWVVRRSQTKRLIQKKIGHTDQTTLKFRDPGVRSIGSIWLIHGLGDEVVADHTDSIEILGLIHDRL